MNSLYTSKYNCFHKYYLNLWLHQSKYIKCSKSIQKLDVVGLVDDRPSRDKLQPPKKLLKKLHLPPDIWYKVGGEHSPKISAPQHSQFGVDNF